MNNYKKIIISKRDISAAISKEEKLDIVKQIKEYASKRDGQWKEISEMTDDKILGVIGKSQTLNGAIKTIKWYYGI